MSIVIESEVDSLSRKIGNSKLSVNAKILDIVLCMKCKLELNIMISKGNALQRTYAVCIISVLWKMFLGRYISRIHFVTDILDALKKLFASKFAFCAIDAKKSFSWTSKTLSSADLWHCGIWGVFYEMVKVHVLNRNEILNQFRFTFMAKFLHLILNTPCLEIFARIWNQTKNIYLEGIFLYKRGKTKYIHNALRRNELNCIKK